ncbi:uncharacterized protein ofcc1 [Anguilla rostrata]|uniref:uncharacterized protein ofcc1 n=1 Tax=Anguilla rostrata TaxID=7938 RepID=UPI0030D10D33
MDTFGSKFQQKALKQPKQKKSESAEFLMGEDERAAAEGIENPAFDGRDGDLSAYHALGSQEIERDKQDSTLAAQKHKMELQAPAEPRGNECARNYFDPPMAEETNPRQCRMEVGTEDELELKLMREGEQELYYKMSVMLTEDDTTTIIDLPGTALPDEEAEVKMEVTARGAALLPAPPGRGRAAQEEPVPCYAERLKECVRGDVIALGSLSPEQNAHSVMQKGMSQEAEREEKKRLMSFLRGNAEEFNTHRDLHQQEQILHDKLHAAFQRAESQLLKALRKRKGEVIAKYGTMAEVTAPPDREHGLHWQVEWSRTPQPVEIHLLCLRAVRDKLPRGHYAVSVALHARLGGRALRWSRLKERPWAGTTERVEHRGRFHDAELRLDQSVSTVLPASSDVVPSMVLQFRLLSFPGERSHVSTVAAWGAFPVCGCGFDIVQGKFRTPLLRGERAPALDQFRKVEELMSSDLDNWLCNLYFQVKKLPRGASDGAEYSVALEVPSQSQPCAGGAQGRGCGTVEPQPQGSPLSLSARSRCSSASLRGKDSSQVIPENAERASGAFPVKGDTGMYYKKNQSPKISGSNPCLKVNMPPLQCGKQEMISVEELEEYTFSLQPQQSCGRRAGGAAAEHTHLALRMFLSELGLSQWRSPEFCFIMLLLALIWFVRLYLHYCSQWLFLQAIAVPVNKFRFHLHTVELVYQNSLLHTREELAMVVIGPLTLNAVTLLLVLIRWGCQLIFSSFPSFLSKFIMALGVWTVLDPLAVFAVDAILGRLAYSAEQPMADAAKLYWHFHRTENSGAPGILITLFLYTVLFLCSITILYIYFFRLHNDGRMLDVFQRLHSKEEAFFIPHDLELSNQELSYIVKKAEQWRGFNGERRKVAVYDYIWMEDPSAGRATSSCDPQHGAGPSGATPGRGETSTRVSVYTLHLSGLREQHRHFLRQPDGAIVEVTGNVDSAEPPVSVIACPGKRPQKDAQTCSSDQLRERKKKKAAWRSHRVEPAGRSCSESGAAPKHLSL